jgi:hypothetical protein
VGAASPQVARALRAALEGIETVAPPSRQGPLDRQIELLSAAVDREFETDAHAAVCPTDSVSGADQT